MNRTEKRAAQRRKLLKYARWVEVPEAPGERIHLAPITAFDLQLMEQAQTKVAEDGARSLWEIIEIVILDWTFTDDDGEKFPLTEEAVRELIPLDLLRIVVETAMAVVSGSVKAPFVGTSSPVLPPTSPATSD